MDQLRNLLDRPQHYKNIDGLTELGGSVMCLGLALQVWLRMSTPSDSVWNRASFLVFLALILLIPYGTRTLKARITFPRTGFVEYRKPVRAQAIGAVAGALATLGLAVGFRRNWDLSSLAVLAGLAFAGSCGYHFARAVRWKWIIAGAMAMASLAIGFAPRNFLSAMGSGAPTGRSGGDGLNGTVLLALLAYGVLLLISGGISFWLYLRRTGAPSQEAQ